MDYKIPEPSLEPPEDYYITADCGHEVYEGEYVYYYNSGDGERTFCPDCMEEKFEDLTLEEKVLLMGGYFAEVER